jgi:4-alpha-glucanotransferase
MEARGFPWWKRRFRRHFELFDEVRIDHFRGFDAYWAVPAGEETAVEGEWLPAPGAALFDAMEAEFGSPLPVVAEDLGLVTPSVTALIEQFDLPGMAVLEFAFGSGPHNSFLPHRHRPRQVCYTGTHDNDTLMGWWKTAPEHEREHALQYLGLHHSDEPLHWAFVRAALASPAGLTVIPLQDVLGLGSEARMNTPGTVGPQNWTWRVSEGLLNEHIEGHLRYLADLYGRLPVPPEVAAALAAGVDLAVQPDPATQRIEAARHEAEGEAL